MKAPSRPYLLARTRSVLAALPVEAALETMRPLPATPIAGQPPFMIGVAVIRGEPTPVLDLAALLGGAPGVPSRYVTLRTGGRTAALAVDEVLGIRRLDAVDDLPPLLQGANPSMIGLMATLDAKLLAVLDSSKAVPDRAWSAAEGAGK